MKFVELDGKKFVDDGTGKAKVDDKGQPVPYVEEKAPDIKDYSNADLETLSKINPFVAKALSEKADADKKLAEFAKSDDEAKRKEAEQKGEWQKLANEEKAKREAAEQKLKEKEEQLGKYAGSMQNMLEQVLTTIPKENLTLIPEGFSARQKLEYITKNAKLLGAKNFNGVGGDIPGSDGKPNLSDEQKLRTEFDDLLKKGAVRTALETQQMIELGGKIKKLAADKNKK